ncbi:MAG: hypothetical protein KAX65_01925 [Caldilineaceae bacterium]|nr:hypothetical protein [Caldilineaceae bacterium]
MFDEVDKSGKPVTTPDMGIPVPDPNHTSCADRRDGYQEWTHQQHGVNPFRAVTPDCERFSLPDYYYKDWQGLPVTAVEVEL